MKGVKVEKKIIAAAIQSREACSKLHRLLTEQEFSEVGAELFKRIVQYYEVDPEAEEVDIDLLKAGIYEDMPKQADIVCTELNDLKQTSVPNLLREVSRLKKKAISQEIIQALARNPESADAASLMDKFTDLEEIEEDVVESVSDQARAVLAEMSERTDLIQIYPKCLNDAVDGGVMRGSHVVVFARPNIGKTMTVVNMGAMMAYKGHRVLHLMNEEPKKQLMLRYISRLSGKNRREVYQDIDAAVDLAEKRGLQNVFIEDINPGTFHEIRGLIDHVKPDVVIIDQLRNIRVKDDSKVGQLEKAATEARNLAKHYDIVVISVTQAGDSASGKAVLSDSDIDSSKTGIPGQCDLIIGVGADDNQRKSGLRTMTIVKNKITNVHEFYAVRVQEDISKIESS